MFLKTFTSSIEIYFNSYCNFNSNDYDTYKSFNSHGIIFIEKSNDNNGLFIIIKNKKIEADLSTSVHKKNSSYHKIIKNNIFRSIIEESLRGTIIPT